MTPFLHFVHHWCRDGCQEWVPRMMRIRLAKSKNVVRQTFVPLNGHRRKSMHGLSQQPN